MTTKTVTVIDGDLLDVTEGIIAHQVNCYGVVAGLAGAIAQRYPTVESRYVELCHELSPEVLLGHAQLVLNATPEHPDLMVANLFGQLTPGPATDYDAVRTAVRQLTVTASTLGYFGPLHVPYLMGCGIGGGDWDTYSAILCEEWPGEVIAHRLVP